MGDARSNRWVIRQTRHYYGPTTKKALVTDFGVSALTFDRRKDAVKHKEMLDRMPHHTDYNETGSPEYDVVLVGRLPAYLRAELEEDKCPSA